MTVNKLAGAAYQHKRMTEAPVRKLQTLTIPAETAAQAMTLIAYGDGNKDRLELPFRSLDFKCKCDDYHDAVKCIEIIHGYNEFDAATITRLMFTRLHKRAFLNEDNPNNGMPLFDFHIAREGSPALYIGWNEKYHDKYIVDWEQAGTSRLLQWQRYTGEDFKRDMNYLKTAFVADEMDITYNNYYGEMGVYECRFWWD